jgi:MFS family permease
VGWTGYINASYNFVTFCSAFALLVLAKRYGAKLVHAASLVLAAGGLIALGQLENKYLMFLPMIGLGIAWGSVMGVPYIMAVACIPKERFGVYMGIINMMICIPQLIETLTFDDIHKHLLHSDPSLAIMFAGGLFLLAAIAMLWVKQPPDPGAATEDLTDEHFPVASPGAALTPATGPAVIGPVVPPGRPGRPDQGHHALACCQLLSAPCQVHLELFHAVSVSEPATGEQAGASACCLLAHQPRRAVS